MMVPPKNMVMKCGLTRFGHAEGASAGSFDGIENTLFSELIQDDERSTNVEQHKIDCGMQASSTTRLIR
jgi:hypothetical protein